MAFTRIGFGQVEPNQLSAQKTGQIYARLPLDPEVSVLENGTFMYYDYAADPEPGMVWAGDDNTKGEPMLVFNEIKIYEERLQLKDFAMIRVEDTENYVTNPAATGRITSANTDGVTYGDGALTKGVKVEHTRYPYRMDGFAPRLFKTNIGDIFTTNMVELDVEYKRGDVLKLKKDDEKKVLYLSPDGSVGDMEWQVVQVYTMPDGQPGLKVQRVQ